MLLMFMLQMYNFYFILTNILTENLHGNLLFATCYLFTTILLHIPQR